MGEPSAWQGRLAVRIQAVLPTRASFSALVTTSLDGQLTSLCLQPFFYSHHTMITPTMIPHEARTSKNKIRYHSHPRVQWTLHEPLLRDSQRDALYSCSLLFFPSLLLHELGDSKRVAQSRDLHDRSIFNWLDKGFVDGARVEFYFFFLFALSRRRARLP